MVIKRDIWITPFQCNRTLHIYIPENCSADHPASVMYMFDGHNLFFDWDATYGTCWGLKDYLDKRGSNIIIVGIECNHNGNDRLDEFSPYDYLDPDFGYVHQKGRALIDWMVNELKPWIDQQYPTKKDREHTYVGGSSMGGLMSLYMALKYSHVYSKAVAVSPHIYPLYKSLRNDLGYPMLENTTVYMSWGGQEYPTHEIFAMATDQNLQIIRALMKKQGVDVIPHVFKNDNHSEYAWRKELPIWFEELNLHEE